MAVALFGAGAEASAAHDEGGAQTRLQVTATVPKRVSLEILAQPAAVVITAEDIMRGHVDVPMQIEIVIRSNSTEYLLDFSTTGNFMRQIIVSGFANEVQFGPEGGVAAQTAAPDRLSRQGAFLAFRFVLSESARPGTYPWPVRLSAVPM